jgi:hypothetical protein
VHNILCGSEEGTARSVPPATYNDASSFTGQWTVYTGLYSDSEDESTAPAPIPKAGRTQRSASTPPADRSQLPADRHRHDDLARRLGRSPSVMTTYLLAYEFLNPQPLPTDIKPLTNMITYLTYI